MSISPVLSYPALQQPKTDVQKAALDYNAFVNLLLQELKSQDPTNPVDQKQTLAQLASFSIVEQSIKMNQKLDALIGSSGIGNAANLIGKHVETLSADFAGLVKAIEIDAKGASVILENGTRLAVNEGLRISRL
jgi:flagellar basal-body rod modification protein FlgD